MSLMAKHRTYPLVLSNSDGWSGANYGVTYPGTTTSIHGPTGTYDSAGNAVPVNLPGLEMSYGSDEFPTAFHGAQNIYPNASQAASFSMFNNYTNCQQFGQNASGWYVIKYGITLYSDDFNVINGATSSC